MTLSKERVNEGAETKEKDAAGRERVSGEVARVLRKSVAQVPKMPRILTKWPHLCLINGRARARMCILVHALIKP